MRYYGLCKNVINRWRQTDVCKVFYRPLKAFGRWREIIIKLITHIGHLLCNCDCLEVNLDIGVNRYRGVNWLATTNHKEISCVKDIKNILD